MKNKNKKFVVLPDSARKALYSLQDEPTGAEWGGGIDFEIVKGRPQIERIITYYAEEGMVPSRILGKYRPDVEVEFHTHPDSSLAVPSPEDIHSFIVQVTQQVWFILARDEMIVLEKTRNTPKKQVSTK